MKNSTPGLILPWICMPDCKFLRKKLKILLAFAVMLLMCLSHDILFDKVTPRYFTVFTDSST